jgi:hypothetical protein
MKISKQFASGKNGEGGREAAPYAAVATASDEEIADGRHAGDRIHRRLRLGTHDRCHTCAEPVNDVSMEIGCI